MRDIGLLCKQLGCSFMAPILKVILRATTGRHRYDRAAALVFMEGRQHLAQVMSTQRSSTAASELYPLRLHAVVDLVEGLQEMGIVHNDLKPEKVVQCIDAAGDARFKTSQVPFLGQARLLFRASQHGFSVPVFHRL